MKRCRSCGISSWAKVSESSAWSACKLRRGEPVGDALAERAQAGDVHGKAGVRGGGRLQRGLPLPTARAGSAWNMVRWAGIWLRSGGKCRVRRSSNRPLRGGVESQRQDVHHASVGWRSGKSWHVIAEADRCRCEWKAAGLSVCDQTRTSHAPAHAPERGLEAEGFRPVRCSQFDGSGTEWAYPVCALRRGRPLRWRRGCWVHSPRRARRRATRHRSGRARPRSARSWLRFGWPASLRRAGCHSSFVPLPSGRACLSPGVRVRRSVRSAALHCACPAPSRRPASTPYRPRGQRAVALPGEAEVASEAWLWPICCFGQSAWIRSQLSMGERSPPTQ